MKRHRLYCCEFVWFGLIVLLSSSELCGAHMIGCITKPISDGELGITSQEDLSQIQVFGQNLTSGDCTLWKSDKEGNACKNLTFPPLKSGYYSDVGIHPFKTDNYYNFNISFTNIDWKYLQLYSRMQGPEPESGKPFAQWCAQLFVPEGFVPDAVLSFAIHQWGSWSESMSTEVKVGVGQNIHSVMGYGHFLMFVPKVDDVGEETDGCAVNITRLPILVALEVSRSPTLFVIWPQVLPCFNVDFYIVTIQDDPPEMVKASEVCRKGVCCKEVSVGWRSRKVVATVHVVHPQCPSRLDCLGQSPVFQTELNIPVHVSILAVVVCVLLLLIVVSSVYFVCCVPPFNTPMVLFVFDATERQHSRASRILAEYLEGVGRVKCLLDEEEVPKHESKNASKWLEEVFESADAVVVMASPSSHSPIRFSLYPNVFSEALVLIERRVQCQAHKGSEQRLLVAQPPYLTEEELPSELRPLRRFQVPSELDLLLWSLYHTHMSCRPIACLARVWLRAFGCPGPMSAFRHRGERLAEALTLASAEYALQGHLPQTPEPSWKTNFTFKYDVLKGREESGGSDSLVHGARYPDRISNLDLGMKQQQQRQQPPLEEDNPSVEGVPHPAPFQLSALPLLRRPSPPLPSSFE